MNRCDRERLEGSFYREGREDREEKRRTKRKERFFVSFAPFAVKLFPVAAALVLGCADGSSGSAPVDLEAGAPTAGARRPGGLVRETSRATAPGDGSAARVSARLEGPGERPSVALGGERYPLLDARGAFDRASVEKLLEALDAEGSALEVELLVPEEVPGRVVEALVFFLEEKGKVPIISSGEGR